MALNVYRNSQLVGTLDMHDDDVFYSFRYDAQYLRSKDARPLSISLPLRAERFSGSQTLPYFEGLLPEGSVRDVVAKQFHVSPGSPAQLIRALGRDCAGDVAVLDQDDPEQPPSSTEYLLLPNGLRDIAENPLEKVCVLRAEYRLSLAGAQEKIALYHDDACDLEDGWYAPVNGSPSSHIVKPQVSNRFPDLALNEFLCMQAAAFLGVDTASVSLLYPKSPLLIVRRFDRFADGTVEGISATGAQNFSMQKLTRLHQEDFCQALGYTSFCKYEGNKSSYAPEIASLILAHSSYPIRDLEDLYRLMLYNYAIGNCDGHLKNYSFLQTADGLRLAPAYDLVSTTIYDGLFGYELSRSLGIRMGKHSNIDKVTPDDLSLLADCLHQPPDKAVAIAAGILASLESAFAHAAACGRSFDFEGADELAERIVGNTSKRIQVLEFV